MMTAAAAGPAAPAAADWPDGDAQLHPCSAGPAVVAWAQLLLRPLLPAWASAAVAAAFLQAAGLCAPRHHYCLLEAETAAGVGAAPQPR